MPHGTYWPSSPMALAPSLNMFLVVTNWSSSLGLDSVVSLINGIVIKFTSYEYLHQLTDDSSI